MTDVFFDTRLCCGEVRVEVLREEDTRVVEYWQCPTCHTEYAEDVTAEALEDHALSLAEQYADRGADW